MPRPSVSSKFGSSILKFLKQAQFLMHTQTHFGILNSWISLHKLAHLSVPIKCFEYTPTPWLTLLLVLGKSCVKQNSC